jgi:hypothetical protein
MRLALTVVSPGAQRAADVVLETDPATPAVQVAAERQRLLTNEMTVGMVERGLLAGDTAQRGSGYSLKPELGIMLAARCRSMHAPRSLR